jgi:hypothetical protein
MKALALPILLVACSSQHARPMTPADPRFAKAVDAAIDATAHYYHLPREVCGAAAGYHFGVSENGNQLIVHVVPPHSPPDQLTVTIDSRDFSVAAVTRVS